MNILEKTGIVETVNFSINTTSEEFIEKLRSVSDGKVRNDLFNFIFSEEKKKIYQGKISSNSFELKRIRTLKSNNGLGVVAIKGIINNENNMTKGIILFESRLNSTLLLYFLFGIITLIVSIFFRNANDMISGYSLIWSLGCLFSLPIIYLKIKKSVKATKDEFEDFLIKEF